MLHRAPSWVRGALAGLLWAGLLYGFAHLFFEPELQYSAMEGIEAVTASVLAGVLASSFVKKL